MLIRIVKMSFKPEHHIDFITQFESKRHLIAASNGCLGVELLRDISNPSLFFTYSTWQSETDLNSYRNSDLFNEVWNTVKQWFNDKPEAWSVNKV